MNNQTFENWGGTLHFRPKKIFYPQSLQELQAVVQSCDGHTTRVIGAGHSWTPLITTDDALISLRGFQGIETVISGTQEATVRAGTNLRKLGELLRKQGLAMENLGDIDEQAIAGAISTGTHGTGMHLGILSTQLREITLVTADGNLLTCSTDHQPEIFKAAQVSLGALGVLAHLRFQLVPAYNLVCIKTREKFETCLERIDEYRFGNRNFEFFWFPYSELVSTKCLNITTEEPKHEPLKKYLVDVVYENGTFKALSEISRIAPKFSKSISQLAAAGIANGREVNYSNRIYATARLVRFYEMEYGVPAEAGPTVLREIKKWIAKSNISVHFPLEYRYVKGDDIWLSPAYGRDTAFISVHMYQGMPYQSYFRGIESIFLAHGGRPHWGKMHQLTATQLATMYPKWEDFLAVRKQLDPAGKWLNPYLKQIFGLN